MAIIFHVTSASAWVDATATGEYIPPSLGAEGFIHCSVESQVQGVLERYFAGQTGLVKLVIDTDKLTSPLKYEWSASTGEEFPHVFGPINTGAVTEVKTLR